MAILVIVPRTASAADVFTATTSGDWDDPTTWGGVVPLIDEPSDIVMIPEGITVTIAVGEIVAASNGVRFSGGNASIINHGELTIRGELHLEFVTLENSGTLEVRSTLDDDGALLTEWSEIQNSGTFLLNGNVEMFATDFTNDGSVANSGIFDLNVRSIFRNHADRIFTNDGTLILGSPVVAVPIQAHFFNSGTLINNGYVLVEQGVGAFFASLGNTGLVFNSLSGVMDIGGSFYTADKDGATTEVVNLGLITFLQNGRGGIRAGLENRGPSVIDNSGTIDFALGRFGIENPGGEYEDVIYNRPGGTIISGLFIISSGRFVNESGASFIIPVGESLQNDAIIENDGAVSNSGHITNNGTFYQLCNGNFEEPNHLGTYSGNPVIDACDTTPPTIIEFIAGTLGTGGWYTSDVTVTWTVADPDTPITITSGCDPQTVNADTASIQFTCTATSYGGTTSETVTIKRDATAPTAGASVSGTVGDNGWYVSDVTVSFSGSDGTSGIAGCDADVVLSSEGSGHLAVGTCTDNAGNVSLAATASGINIDKTAPTATADASPAPNGNGWNNTDVTVSFSGSDALSDIDFCDTPVVLSGEGAGQSASGTCTDLAGNVSASATASGINIDKTAPVVSVTGVGAGATYILGSVPNAGCDTQDPLSGIATAASLTLSGGIPDGSGAITATCDGAVDKAGNSGSASVTYTVMTPQDATGEVLADIQALVDTVVLKRGQANGLMHPLANAIRSLDKGKTSAACNQLQDFIDEVNAKTPEPLDAATAAELIADAEEIGTAIDCG